MIVHIRLHTTLRKETPEGVVDQLDLELEPGTTVTEVLTRLDIPPRLGSIVMAVNGALVKDDHVLADGDTLRLVPSVSGG